MKVISASKDFAARVGKEFLDRRPEDATVFFCTEGVPAGANPARCISIGDGLDPRAVLATALGQGVKHVIPLRDKSLTSEVDLSVQMICQLPKFLADPCGVFFGPAMPPGSKCRFVRPFSSSTEKNTAIEELARFIGADPGAEMILDSIQTIADELFMNAMFSAPADGGKGRHRDVSRTAKVELKPGEKAELFLAYDPRHVLVGSIDPFGSLEIPKLIEKIRDTYDGDVMNVNFGAGGAGIGTRMIFDLCKSLLIAVEPGKRTVVAASIPLKTKVRTLQSLEKSLHFGVLC